MTLEKMTSRHQPASRHVNVRAVGVSVLLAATMALGGCGLLPEETTAPVPTTDSSTAAPAKEVAKETDKPAQPVTAAEEFSKKLTGILTTLAAGTKAPNREQMKAAMLDAGAVEEKIEISIDITPTGLAVDAIEAASPVAEECVIGQVRDGNVAVTILPTLASGRCFVGDAH
ncbi:hypothetical protein [Arthrobacter sp. H35-D1]|uniref:DUF6993 domain-containing protein n=1 Tax=Arthrobacter sp. H35-D1 TaxID=3046202 RepID=UPI0024B89D25|nr:hypothetical protein [Arthrobacter sp. H35-D1]MDJ0313903.1 hypothetical protein [Arthrobacter sp. H35-D1]